MHENLPSGRSNVILEAKLEYAAKSDKAVELDLWYSSIYELAFNDIDLRDYSDMSSLFENKVTF